jgi:hypothetical protein
MHILRGVVEMGPFFEGLDHCEVIDRASSVSHFFRAYLLEHPASRCVVELLVEFLRSALLGQALFLPQRVAINLIVVIHQLRCRYAKGIRRHPLFLTDIQLEPPKDDLVFLIFFERQGVGLEGAFFAPYAGSASPREIRAEGLGRQEIRELKYSSFNVHRWHAPAG